MYHFVIINIVFSLVFLSCTSSVDQGVSDQSLKRIYEAYFPIGASVGPSSIAEDSSFLSYHYASLTAENDMKANRIHPQKGYYNWGPSDSIVSFAKANKMKVRGHALVWYRSTPTWMCIDSLGAKRSPDDLMGIMKNHIHEVVSRYRDEVYCWDVVNEAISDDSLTYWREDSVWFKTLGPQFIDSAFFAARKADPNAELFYNEYLLLKDTVKRSKVIKLIKGMQQRGVPIDGLGIQAHWDIKNPSREVIQETLDQFYNLGIKIQITELDISNYIWGEEDEVTFKDYNQEIDSLLAEQYKNVFDILRANREKIDAVTFWNYSDKKSWLQNIPITRPNSPHLFDRELKPKKAYYAVTNFENK